MSPPLGIGYLSGSPRITTSADAAADVVGPRAHVVGFVDALRSQGHTVTPFVLGDVLGRPRAGSPRVGRAASPSSAPRRLAVDLLRLLLRPVAAWWAARAVPRDVDVVYERYALFQELGRPWQRRGVPWVVETNALLAEEARRERSALFFARTAWWLERRTYRRADLVVAVSEPLRELLVDRAGVAPERVLVVPNGVDVARFAAVAERERPAALVVGFVGFVIERQGLDELLDAVRVLRADGVDVRAVVVGDGPDRATLEERSRRLGLEQAVQFAGQAPWEQVPAWLGRFSVGYSGQRGVAGMTMYHSPLKIYEYLAAGLPVVASAHPDAVSVLQSSGGGATFPPGDRNALVDVLRQMAALTQGERAELGRRGRAHVVAEHSWASRTRQVTDAVSRRTATLS